MLKYKCLVGVIIVFILSFVLFYYTVLSFLEFIIILKCDIFVYCEWNLG